MSLHEGKWLKKKLRTIGTKQEVFANQLGISRNQLIVLMKESSLSPKYRLNILSLLNMTEEEFETHALQEEYSESLAENESPTKNTSISNNMWIIPAKALTGFVKGFPSRIFSAQIQKVSFPMINEECFCFEVEGSTMYPFYLPGSFVVCTLLQDWAWLRRGKAYIFQSNEEILLKTYERSEGDLIYLKSENPLQNSIETMPLSDLGQVYAIDYKIIKE